MALFVFRVAVCVWQLGASPGLERGEIAVLLVLVYITYSLDITMNGAERMRDSDGSMWCVYD
jgi:hypothetical protein